MRNFFLLPRLIFLALVLVQGGSFCAAHADPLPSSSPEPVLPDPPANYSHNFPASSAQGGIADPGSELTEAGAAGMQFSCPVCDSPAAISAC